MPIIFIKYKILVKWWKVLIEKKNIFAIYKFDFNSIKPKIMLILLMDVYTFL